MPSPNLELRVSHCPHCGKLLAAGLTSPYQYGSPRIVCIHCGKQHFDGFYREKALVEYRERIPIWSVWLCAAFVVHFLYMDYRMLQLKPEKLLPETIVFFSLMTVVSIVILFVVLYRRQNRDEYETAKEEKLEERFRNADRLDKELAASLRRLSNEDYLYYLIDNEVEVPDYFFRRAGLCRDEERIRKTRQKREIQNEKKRLQDELEYHEYYLSLGTEDRIFRQQAQSKGMEFKTFEDFCRRQVELCRKKLMALDAEDVSIDYDP